MKIIQNSDKVFYCIIEFFMNIACYNKHLKKMLFFLFLLFLNANSILASMRIDLSDRTPEEVVKNSISLGKKLEVAKITGSICIKDEAVGVSQMVGSGVAIDPNTILTSAHLHNLKVTNKIFFSLDSDARIPIDDYYKVSSLIVHPTFKKRERCLLGIDPGAIDPPLEYILEKKTIFSIKLNEVESITFEDYGIKCRPLMKAIKSFSGVDLAILKLDQPLPQDLSYPSLEAIDYNEITDWSGISVGFGGIKYNMINEAPLEVDDQYQSIRHVISCRASPGVIEKGNNILYGEYKGLLINGDESFITNNNMKKTEGLPTKGDSGGPFFLKINDQYKLAGILSATLALAADPIDTAPIIEKYPSWKNILPSIQQSIFPIWQDIRPHLSWIKENMEKTQQ